mgnify:CR=1 FL=1
MQTYVDRGVVSGITTLVARHGKLVHWESTGFRDLETQDPLEPNDIFRIYSMTKPVTAVAIMMLVPASLRRIIASTNRDRRSAPSPGRAITTWLGIGSLSAIQTTSACC